MLKLKSYFIKDKKLGKKTKKYISEKKNKNVIENKNKSKKVKKLKKNKNKIKKNKNKITISGLDEENIINLIKNQTKSLKCDFLKTHNAKYIGEGVKNVVLEGCVDTNCNKKIAIRLMGISNLYKYDKYHPINIEIDLYKKINKFNDKNIFPHVPYLLKSINCDYSKIFNSLNDLNNNNKKEKLSEVDIKLMEQIYYKEIKKEIKIIALEYCHLGSLSNFIVKYRKNNDYLRNAMFQAILGLVTLQYHIKEFKHNDLHTENVLLGNFNFKNEMEYKNLIKEEKNKYYIKYQIFGEEYYIPYLGFCVKLFDFDNSTSKGNHNVKLDKDLLYPQYGSTNLINPIFDYHLLINSGFHGLHEQEKLSKEFNDFYEEQVEKKYRGKWGNFVGFHRLTNYYTTYDYHDVNLIPDSIANPYDILFEHKIFEEYRKIPNNPDFIVIHTYNTNVPKMNDSQKKSRKDMFK